MSHALPVLLVLGLVIALGVRRMECGKDLEAGPMPETVWTDQNTEAVTGPTAPPPLTPNQKRPPCTAGLELEVNGGCWLAIERTAPNCPPQTVTYEGRCLLRVARPQPVPVSVDAGGP
ncbi:protein kinase [Cystobacter fuscus]|uniref:Protein kinase n=1 Tax=Cystobacter fuscus TaxID=43 RepID=A0A250JEX6_9BACT|nr:protein kinase [Cystobacter fuscus]